MTLLRVDGRERDGKGRTGNRSNNNAPRNTYRTRDGQ
jgi:hypothetical protein